VLDHREFSPERQAHRPVTLPHHPERRKRGERDTHFWQEAWVTRPTGPRTLAVISLALAAGVLALPSAASANLPTKPSCSAVARTLLRSTFGYSFPRYPTSKQHHTKTLQRLVCTYHSGRGGKDGDLSIEYYRYSSNNAARAHYSSIRKRLIRQGNNQSMDVISQVLPLIKLRGICDMALRTDDGTTVQFVEGVDFVTIDNGFADINSRTISGMVALASYVDRHA
jgi:hypothetical protein